MILFHGTTEIIESPNVSFSKNYLDFVCACRKGNNIYMDIYYHSRLAEEIEQGTYGIENMDYKYLVQDLIENEPELFPKLK